MGSLLKTMLSGLHVAFRGKSIVKTKHTLNDMRYTHRLKTSGDSNDEAYVILRCQQLRHTVVYERWYMPSRTHFTYRVEIVHVHGPKHYERPSVCYPHLCAYWLHVTTYPHHCAVNAYIDHIIEANSMTLEL